MKGQYCLIKRFNLLKDFRKYLLSNKTTLRHYLDYGAYWYDYLVRNDKPTREGKYIKYLGDNAERLYIEYKNSKYTNKAMSLERLTELKNNQYPVVDKKRIQQILARRERKARKRDVSSKE